MISIIPPNALPQIPSSGHVSAPTGTASFSTLLDDDATQPPSLPEASFQIDASREIGSLAEPKSKERLFTFTELGMFGCHDAQLMPAGKLDPDIRMQPQAISAASIALSGKLGNVPSTGGKPASSTNDTSLLLRQPTNEISVESNESPFVSARRVAQGPTESDADPASAEVAPVEEYLAVNEITVPEAVPSPANAESFEVVPGEEALSPLEGGAPMPASSVELKNPNSAPVNLAVLGSSEALVVSIRSPIEAGESMVRLRQSIESLAAEFGMDVAELRINGSPLSQISPSAKGGSNGGRAG